MPPSSIKVRMRCFCRSEFTSFYAHAEERFFPGWWGDTTGDFP